MQYVKKIYRDSLHLLDSEPEGLYDGYEITLSNDPSEEAELFNYSNLQYVKGFRLPGLSAPIFEVADIMKHFNYVFYVAHMAQLLGIKKHGHVYLDVSNSYSVNFFKSNVRAFNDFICNLVMLNNDCTYVEFIVENSPLYYKWEDELVLAQNGGAPAEGIVHELRSAGLFCFHSGFNVSNAVKMITTPTYVSSPKFRFEDYLGDECKLVNLYGMSNCYTEPLVEQIKDRDIFVVI